MLEAPPASTSNAETHLPGTGRGTVPVLVAMPVVRTALWMVASFEDEMQQSLFGSQPGLRQADAHTVLRILRPIRRSLRDSFSVHSKPQVCQHPRLAGNE